MAASGEISGPGATSSTATVADLAFGQWKPIGRPSRSVLRWTLHKKLPRERRARDLAAPFYPGCRDMRRTTVLSNICTKYAGAAEPPKPLPDADP
jgi:hypothetical protein